MQTHRVIIMAVAVALLGGALTAAADEAQTGRALAAKWGPAVVRVQLVVKYRMSSKGQESAPSENKDEGTGVIVDPSGLTLVPLIATDPGSMMSAMFGEEGGYEVKSEVTDAKIRLADGVEIPAQVVLRDKDLGMSFLRPVKKPAAPLPCVNLADAAAPLVLDPVIVLTRLGKLANRTLGVSLARIQGVVEKPRKFYLPGSGSGELGSVVFDMEGKLVGVMLLRTAGGDGGPGGGPMGRMMASGGDFMLPVIVPAADIAEVAKQAPMEAPKTAAAPTGGAATKPAPAPNKPAK